MDQGKQMEWSFYYSGAIEPHVDPTCHSCMASVMGACVGIAQPHGKSFQAPGVCPVCDAARSKHCPAHGRGLAYALEQHPKHENAAAQAEFEAFAALALAKAKLHPGTKLIFVRGRGEAGIPGSAESHFECDIKVNGDAQV